MSSEIVYDINTRPSKSELIFDIIGPFGSQIEFRSGEKRKSSLVINNEVQVQATRAHQLTHRYSLTFLNNPKKLVNFSLYSKIMGGYKIIGDYNFKVYNINWTWAAPLGDCNSLVLMDKNDNNQVMAVMSGLSLNYQTRGCLIISNGIANDFRDPIIFSACLIWMIKTKP